jgi:hypothetical protein
VNGQAKNGTTAARSARVTASQIGETLPLERRVERAYDDLLFVASQLEDGEMHLAVMRALRSVKRVDDYFARRRSRSRKAGRSNGRAEFTAS